MIEEADKHLCVPVVRINPDNVSPLFANDLLITRATSNEFFLTFSLIEAPEWSPDDNPQIDTVQAVAKSKLILTPNFAQELIDLLTETLKSARNDGCVEDGT